MATVQRSFPGANINEALSAVHLAANRAGMRPQQAGAAIRFRTPAKGFTWGANHVIEVSATPAGAEATLQAGGGGGDYKRALSVLEAATDLLVAQGIVGQAAAVEQRRATGQTLGANRQMSRAEAEARIVCQFCQQAGGVTTQMSQRKHGISGGKATAGLLTGGVSLLAVGLSRKGWVTVLSCGNCRMKWEVGA